MFSLSFDLIWILKMLWENIIFWYLYLEIDKMQGSFSNYRRLFLNEFLWKEKKVLHLYLTIILFLMNDVTANLV
jgi:hypothetical protein